MQLHEEMATLIKRNDIKIPSYIRDNLRSSITLRPYQESALKHFLQYENDPEVRKYPTHLLFHMATGSGKTVIMAALIIHLYKQGYRHFLFFVDKDNIVQKTKENFLNAVSSKYLFADFISIDGKKINIREVSNFDDTIEDDINIHFSTMSGLHQNLNKPKENAVTYEDFENKKLVLIADEAHHINTLTKKGKLTVKEIENKKSWENTVQNIFNKNEGNFLLEFTATIPLENKSIEGKYKDKIIYSYALKEFRLDGYSKEIQLRQAHLEPLERMFQAVLFSQYRRKIAERHGLQIKPVILMKSKTIDESKANTKNFIKFIDRLTGKRIEKLKNDYSSDESLGKIFSYLFGTLKLAYDDFALEIKGEFSNDKIINVNEESELKKQQVELNSLEDTSNECRVIFAVDKLNEGWDVLNLFDIARLYEMRDTGRAKIGKTTMQEAQLIGRGARYCPFVDDNKKDEPKEKRKYDKETDNPLRYLEELHYHCSHNPQYIHEIKSALQKSGMMDEPQRELIKVKDSFKETELYKQGYIYMNERKQNKNKNKNFLEDYGVSRNYEYSREFSTATWEENALDNKKTLSRAEKPVLKPIFFDKFILRRAADGIPFFAYSNIESYLPNLKSMNELFQKIEKKFSVSVRGEETRIDNLTRKEKKDLCHFLLSEIAKTIEENSTEFIGTRAFKPCKVQKIIKDKHVYINDENQLAKLEREGLFDAEWYVYEKNLINDLEKEFVQYIGDKASKIKEKYNNFYLVRNEKLVKLYDFKTGTGFEPDFLLFAIKNSKSDESLIYELFIEPKGPHTEAGDKWKNDFLQSIKQDYQARDIFSNAKYSIIGLPFYTEKRKHYFRKEFENILGIS